MAIKSPGKEWSGCLHLKTSTYGEQPHGKIQRQVNVGSAPSMSLTDNMDEKNEKDLDKEDDEKRTKSFIAVTILLIYVVTIMVLVNSKLTVTCKSILPVVSSKRT